MEPSSTARPAREALPRLSRGVGRVGSWPGRPHGGPGLLEH